MLYNVKYAMHGYAMIALRLMETKWMNPNFDAGCVQTAPHQNRTFQSLRNQGEP